MRKCAEDYANVAHDENIRVALRFILQMVDHFFRLHHGIFSVSWLYAPAVNWRIYTLTSLPAQEMLYPLNQKQKYPY